MSRKKWTGTEKMAVVRDMLKGDKNVSQLCKEYGVSDSMAYRWRDEALSAMEDVLSGKNKLKSEAQITAEKDRLLKIIEQQQVAIEYQKKIL